MQKVPNRSNMRTLQVLAVVVALAGFACLLAGDWKLALLAVPIFAALSWAWQRANRKS